ncbi:hypothetical protein N9917_03245 [Deltaproteobacteria bacterium]|nr:hypothetical protein [Deltaproteobacteria bacterium]
MPNLRADLIRIASDLPKGDPTRREILSVLKVGRNRLVQQIEGMSNEERKEMGPREQAAYSEAQFEVAVQAVVETAKRQIAKDINSFAKRLDIKDIDWQTGELVPSRYKAQGLLEYTIPKLSQALDDMV